MSPWESVSSMKCELNLSIVKVVDAPVSENVQRDGMSRRKIYDEIVIQPNSDAETLIERKIRYLGRYRQIYAV
jgi:hypothetical protein